MHHPSSRLKAEDQCRYYSGRCSSSNILKHSIYNNSNRNMRSSLVWSTAFVHRKFSSVNNRHNILSVLSLTTSNNNHSS